jgi:hypothetical protein
MNMEVKNVEYGGSMLLWTLVTSAGTRPKVLKKEFSPCDPSVIRI